MVAGSQTGNARIGGDSRVSPLPSRAAGTVMRSLALIRRRTGVWTALTAIYLLAASALLMPWPFGAHPDWAYNWEGYTAWHWTTYWEPPTGPTIDIWAPTDGLMTDSGQGPLVGLPVAIGIALAGVGLDAMRVPVALLAAVSIPALWFLGRRLFGPGPATLVALLMATSPVFLLYGRTATLVGASLVPLLLSALALVRVLDAGAADGWRWRREGLLAASLVLGIYAYAPVRLLWPMAIGLLALAAIRNRARRGVLLRAALLCALIVPAATMALEALAAPDPDPLAAAMSYFHARGEQLVAMSGDPAAASEYLRTSSTVASGWDAVARLVGQNVADLARLLLDRDTGPAPLDFWNERGRFWPWFFLPFAVVGAISTVHRWLFASDVQSALVLPLALFLGLALPLVLTSRVHIGRLLPALPFALLLVAVGAWIVGGWLGDLARRVGSGELRIAHWIAPVLAGALVVPAAVAARVDMETPLLPTREAFTAAALANWHEDARERRGAVLVEDPALGDDIERVHAATYRLALDGVYRFVDIQLIGETSERATDTRPPLFWHGALAALQAAEIPHPCQRLWFVAPEIAAEFFTAWHASGCGGAPDSVILP
ncbi:MAG TPA: glycosyltransferase family 39 protein [Thermomicrobiales bacterium]|nr:glycosyltransferase family 39 protein [Thermomicrobiales bacterium]